MLCHRNTNLFVSLFQSAAENCVRFNKKMRQKNPAPLSLWAVKIVPQKNEADHGGLYLDCVSKWMRWKRTEVERAEWGQMGPRQAVSEAINSSVNISDLRCCIPIRPVTFRTSFLSDILMASFMEISHFPRLSTWKRRTLFHPKGYRQGNTPPLILCCVFKAARAEMNL